jgi:hypothetical protein
MPPVSLTSKQALACTKCGRRASFLTPLGPLCPSDALMAAAFHGWIPEKIRPDVDRADSSPSSS